LEITLVIVPLRSLCIDIGITFQNGNGQNFGWFSKFRIERIREARL